MTNGQFVAAIAFMLAAVMSIVLHELAHGYAAIRSGDITPKMYGRMTLNPVKHFDLFGFLMFAFVGFGWARPVPVNPNNFKDFRKGLLFVSTAGVLTNLAIAFIATPLIYLLGSVTVPVDNQLAFHALTFAYYFLYFARMICLVLFVFNLIPIAPLDGFRIVEAVTKPYNAYRRFMYAYGQYMLIAFLALIYLLARPPVNISVIGVLSDLVATPLDWFWGLFGLA